MNRVKESDAEIRRLRWQCRRGMLELDVALRRLLDEGVFDLGPPGESAFHRLLQTQDQILYEWLMGQSIPDDPDMRELIDKMRENRQKSRRAVG
jgi:antitoxin CptB